MIKKSIRFFILFQSTAIFAVSYALAAPLADEKTNRASQQLNVREEEDGSAQSTPYGYVIGAGNMLQIKIFGEASVAQIYRVDDEGYIKHALAGRIKIGGLTVAEAEKLMERKLDGDYVINPQVNVFVLEFSHFSIIGEVRKPGNYEISGRVSIIRAISMAGGFTPVANQKGVQIIRKNPDGTETKMNIDATRIMNGDLSVDVDLQADDMVTISKSFF